MRSERARQAFYDVLIFVIVVIAALSLLQATILRGSVHHNPQLTDGQLLRQTRLAMMTYLSNHNRVPPTWMSLVREHYVVPQTLISVSNPRRNAYEEIGLGPHTAVAVLDGRVSEEELIAAARKYGVTGSWEQLGDVYLSRESNALNSCRDGLVVGLFLVASRSKEHRLAVRVAFANGFVESIPLSRGEPRSTEYLAMVERDRAERAELDLSPPPNYASLILEHMAEQERLAGEEAEEKE